MRLLSGFGRLDERVAALYDGLERADSAVVDPHKWLAAPMGIGAAFVRDRGLLGRAFTLEPAEYLEGAVDNGMEAVSPFDSFGESKRPRATARARLPVLLWRPPIRMRFTFESSP